jgi:hypothetical protein
MRYLVFFLGFSLILLVFFAGCTTTSPEEPGAQLTRQPGYSMTGLKIGDTAFFEYKGFKKKVRVTGFDETSGNVDAEIQNTGDKSIALKSRMWVVDENSVLYSFPDLQDEGLTHGESRSGFLVNLYQFQGIRDSIKNGNITFFYSFGNQEASWKIN